VKYCQGCRKAKCVCPIPKEIWVCYDIDNGAGIERRPGAKHYVWWFGSRREALQQMKEHHKNKLYTRLIGPFRYIAEIDLVVKTSKKKIRVVLKKLGC